MEPRFRIRREELLVDAEVDPSILHDVLPRLERFLDPFISCLRRSEQVGHARCYVAGLISALPDKNIESIAYLHDQKRDPLQSFIGRSTWDHRPLVTELVRQVAHEMGQPDGVLVFDPSSFPKQGTHSVGVARQWCGRLGKVDNCQVGVYLAYVSEVEHALVDVRLYLPEQWTKDRTRLNQVGVPKEVRFQTRHNQALEMLDQHRTVLPHGWVAGDDEMGRSSAFRRALDQRGERYLLAVPSNTLVRDLQMQPPEYGGRGRPGVARFVRVDGWREDLPEDAWVQIEVRDGQRGPLVVQVAMTRVRARSEGGRVGPEEVLVVIRRPTEGGHFEHDYYLSNAPVQTEAKEFARVAKAEHRIEECFGRAKGEAGLADYEVRTWAGWYHHQILGLVASWFLIQETRRGKAKTPALTLPRLRVLIAGVLSRRLGCDRAEHINRTATHRLQRIELARFYRWKSLNLLPPRRICQLE